MKRACTLLATAIVGFACAGSVPSPASRATSEPIPAEDHSLDAAAYISKGVPAPDRQWTGDDYARALAVLQPLAKDDPTRLPRRSSARSGPVFGRIAADSNLDLVRDAELPIAQRVGAALVLLQGTSKFLTLYGGVSTPRATFDDELCDLMALTLSQSETLWRLVDEFTHTLPPEERETPARVKGRTRMSQGMAMVISGALTTLGESELYRVGPRIRLANALAVHLPVIQPHLTPGTQQEVKVRLENLAAQAGDEELRAAIASISNALPVSP